MAITTKKTIKRKHPVRAEFAGQSTGSLGFAGRTGYYRTKSHAVNAFSGALQGHYFCFDPNEWWDFQGNEGRKDVDIHDDCGNCVGRAIISWFRMESGNYEFCGYIA